MVQAVRQRRHQWTSLEDALREAGIDADEFEGVAVQALGELLRQRSTTNPVGLFTGAEARILSEGGIDLSVRRPGEPDMALRTASRYATMLIEAKSATEVARDLGVTPSRIRQRALERTLYGIRDHRDWRFPSWQFDTRGRPIAGLSVVFPALSRDLHPLVVYRFLSETSPDLEIGERSLAPLEWLASGGDPALVAAIAETL